MRRDKYDLVVIGAGPAGMIAAIEYAQTGGSVLVLEKNNIVGKKLSITGKGRCNITNDAGFNEFVKHFGKKGRFLKYSLSEFSNRDLLDYFRKKGIKFKLERGGRYFPISDKSEDIVNTLADEMHKHRVKLHTGSKAVEISFDKELYRIKTEKNTYLSEKLIIATGGKSYPGTGSSGDGYKFASDLGHTVEKPVPSLVPIKIKGDIPLKLNGLSLKNVSIEVWTDNGKKAQEFGEMLFTRDGLSGPAALTLSPEIVSLYNKKQSLKVFIDMKPGLDHKKLDNRLLREINARGKQKFKNLLKDLLPKKIIPVVLELTGIPEERLLNKITSKERKKLRLILKGIEFEVAGFGSFSQAIVTSGGVSVKEINPVTMESRITPGLYFAGEVIDIDADTGGYNLQAAFSTGMTAARGCIKADKEGRENNEA